MLCRNIEPESSEAWLSPVSPKAKPAPPANDAPSSTLASTDGPVAGAGRRRCSGCSRGGAMRGRTKPESSPIGEVEPVEEGGGRWRGKPVAPTLEEREGPVPPTGPPTPTRGGLGLAPGRATAAPTPPPTDCPPAPALAPRGAEAERREPGGPAEDKAKERGGAAAEEVAGPSADGASASPSSGGAPGPSLNSKRLLSSAAAEDGTDDTEACASVAAGGGRGGASAMEGASDKVSAPPPSLLGPSAHAAAAAAAARGPASAAETEG
mmetsp:Transcript_17324/g.55948  ORF Transcript_17324/g.55948 Transcript_17324/m.55948 type:complete len:266 (-) Transcript_17324:633-1430(-)